jgi:hypothetical protein
MTLRLATETKVRHADVLDGKKLLNSHQKKTATILLVEHHPVFLKLIKKILEAAQFRVLLASNPK